jgi:hypothetical protein
MNWLIFRLFWEIIRSPAVIICMVLAGIAYLAMFGAMQGFWRHW